MKKRLILLCMLFGLALGLAPWARAQSCPAPAWPLWNVFKQQFLQDSGRLLDPGTQDQRTTSEGQSYGMFFALVANDGETFGQLWQWSRDNLLRHQPEPSLPVWLWGKKDDGSWGILDDNSASDANLWFIYALLEAGRLWSQPEYTQAAYDLLAQVELHEVSDLPGLGAMLLPGESGFEHDDDWVLNPSYLPLFILRRLQTESPLSRWGDMAANTVTLLRHTTPKGFAADWITYLKTGTDAARYRPGQPGKAPIGSYDAIRTYLWAGMLPDTVPDRKPLLESLNGMRAYLNQADADAPPESVDVLTGRTHGTGSFGFSAALLPYLQATGDKTLYGQQLKRAEVLLRQTVLPANLRTQPPPYYDFVLSLFGLGWSDGRYEFDENGRLITHWENATCSTPGDTH